MTTKYKYRIGNCPHCNPGHPRGFYVGFVCDLCGYGDQTIYQPKRGLSSMEQEERMQKWEKDNREANARIAGASAKVVAMRERNDNDE